MVRLLVLGLVTGALVLAASARLRREVGEVTRDASDRLIMLLLRATSGFASDVSEQVIAEERERRLRWRSADGGTRPPPTQPEVALLRGRPADRAEIEPPAAAALPEPPAAP